MKTADYATERARATREYHAITRMLSRINPLRNPRTAAVYREMKTRQSILRHTWNL